MKTKTTYFLAALAMVAFTFTACGGSHEEKNAEAMAPAIDTVSPGHEHTHHHGADTVHTHSHDHDGDTTMHAPMH